MNLKKEKYLYKLDSLRFILFLLILYSHSYITPPLVYVGSFISYLYSMAWLGVQGFFVLSGFIITNKLIIEYSRSGSTNFLNFYRSRVLKLLPPLIFIILVVFLISNFGLLNNKQAWNSIQKIEDFEVIALMLFTFSLNVFYAFSIVNVEITPALLILWTLCVEEQFYLVFPLLFSFVIAKFKSVKIAHLVVTFVLLLFLPLVLRIFFYIYNASDFVRVNYTFSLTQVDSLALGVFVALVYRNFSLDFNSKMFVFLLTLCTLLACIYSVSLGQKYMYTVGLSFANLYWGGVILLLASSSNNCKKTIMSNLGKNGYCLYLVHHIALLISFNLTENYSLSEPHLLFLIQYLFALVLSIVLGNIMYRIAEKPFQRFKRS